VIILDIVSHKSNPLTVPQGSSSSSFLQGPVANAPGCTSASAAYCTYPALYVPTFTASRLSRPHHASDPGCQSRNYADEKWPINFAETPTSTKRLGIFYMPLINDMEPTVLLPFRRKARLEFFFALKNPTASAGFEPANP
jgi:hypothetical protein